MKKLNSASLLAILAIMKRFQIFFLETIDDDKGYVEEVGDGATPLKWETYPDEEEDEEEYDESDDVWEEDEKWDDELDELDEFEEDESFGEQCYDGYEISAIPLMFEK